MNTCAETTPKAQAFVALPCHPKFSRDGSTHVIRGLVRDTDISREQLDAFIRKHGYNPDGRTERVRAECDGWIELERTIPNVLSVTALRQKAYTLRDDMQSCFSSVEVSIF
jgi:hypothetical protein